MSTPYQAAPEVVARAVAVRREQLAERVVELDRLRRETAEQKARVDALKRQQASLIENDVARLAEWNAQLEAEESAVRALAIEIHHLAPDASVGTGVNVVQSRKLTYDKAKALEWAKGKRLFLIPESLDAKAFEAFLKTSAGHSDFTDYSITLEPAVKIASDLTLAIAAAARLSTPTEDPA